MPHSSLLNHPMHPEPFPYGRPPTLVLTLPNRPISTPPSEQMHLSQRHLFLHSYFTNKMCRTLNQCTRLSKIHRPFHPICNCNPNIRPTTRTISQWANSAILFRCKLRLPLPAPLFPLGILPRDSNNYLPTLLGLPCILALPTLSRRCLSFLGLYRRLCLLSPPLISRVP
jgi:hypothetical protein